MPTKTQSTTDSPTYSVTRWDECYENNRTRKMVAMQWIPVPNSHDGDGYVELVSRKNGAAYLGAWLAILQVASKGKERGTLVRRNGKPHTAKTIAKITRLDEKIITETLQLLVSEDVAWLCRDGGTLRAPSAHPVDEEGIEGIEGNRKEEKRLKPCVFGEFSNVKMTKEEQGKLIDAHGQAWFDKAIDILDNYMASKGKTYKSCYATMKKGGWVDLKVRESLGDRGMPQQVGSGSMDDLDDELRAIALREPINGTK